VAATSNVRVLFHGDATGATRAIKQVEGSMGGLAKVAGTLAKGLAVGVVVGLAAAAKAAVNFDHAMRDVNTIARLSEKDLKKLEKQVLALSKETAQGPSTLADGLYTLVSSGFKANDAIKVLKASAIAATAGLTDTETATKAVAAALNAYHLEADEARKVSDILFTTVETGVLTFEELAQNMGDLVPAAAPLGIKLEEVGAAMATLTLQGVPAAEAATRVKNSMLQLASPSKELSALLQENGFASAEAAIQARGYSGVLEIVGQATGGNVTATSKLIPEIRALMGFVGLTGKNLKTYNHILKEHEEATDGAGRTAGVFAEQSKSISFQWNKAKATLEAAAVPLGQLLFPLLTKGAEGVAGFAEALTRNMPMIKQQFAGVGDALRTFGGIAKTVATNDLGQGGIVGAITTLSTLNLAGTISKWKSALGGMAAPVSILAIGVGLLAGALYIAATNAGVMSDAIIAAVQAVNQAKGNEVSYREALRQREQAQLNVTSTTKNAAAAEKLYNKYVREGTEETEAGKAALALMKQTKLDAKRANDALSDSEKTVTKTKRESGEATKEAAAKVKGMVDKLDDLKQGNLGAVEALKMLGSNIIHNRNATETIREETAKYNKAVQDIGEEFGYSGKKAQIAGGHVVEFTKKMGRIPTQKNVDIYVKTHGKTTVNIDVYTRIHQRIDRVFAPVRRAGGGFIPMSAGEPNRDSVHAMLTPGEVVLNKEQQDVLGGPRYLASLFGFSGDEGPGFAAGGIVPGGGPTGPRRSRKTPHSPLRKRGYSRLSAKARAALTAVEEVNQRETNLDRTYGQLAREYGLSTEEFVVTDEQGNETLDKAAVQKRMDEIGALVGSRQQMIRLIDEEKRKLERAIAKLKRAIAELLAEIKREQDAARQDAEQIVAWQKKINENNRAIKKDENDTQRAVELEENKKHPKGKAGTASKKASDERVKALKAASARRIKTYNSESGLLNRQIDSRGKRRDQRLDAVQNMRQTVVDFRDAITESRNNLDNAIPFDRRDVQLDIQELRVEATDIGKIKARPNDPPLEDQGIGGTDSVGGSDSDVGSAPPADTSGPTEEELRALREEIARLRLALGVEAAQLGVIGSFQRGTLHVPQTGLALVHAGEKITPAGVPQAASGSGSSTPQVHVYVDDAMGWLKPFIRTEAVKATDDIAERMGRKADVRSREGRF
jgi:TP901 family phage tail tape measure protein